MNEVLEQKNYQVVPFKFNKSLDEVLSAYKNNNETKQRWKIEEKTSAEYLLTYVNNLISHDIKKKGAIGVCFSLNLRCKNLIHLGIVPGSKAEKILYYDNKKFLYKYEFIKVYLFESKVGFLVYSLNFSDENTNVDYIIEANHSFKKYSHSGSYESYEKVIKEKEKNIIQEQEKDRKKYNPEAVKFQQKELEELLQYEESLRSSANKKNKLKRSTIVKLLIETLGLEIEDFFTSTREPDYSHMFTFLRLSKDCKEEDIKRYLYLLKHGVKQSCKPTEKELDVNLGDGNLHLYENFWWGVSIEALTCICKDIDDDNTNSFNKSYKGTIESTYLYMYIIMLHMRYGLLKYIIEASSLSKDILNINGDETEVNKLNELQREIIQFDFRGIFNEISNITPHIRIFELVKDKLRINSLNNELQNEIENLSKLANIYTEKIEKKHSDKMEMIFQSIAIILAGLSASTYIRDAVESSIGISIGELSKLYLLVPSLPIVFIVIAFLAIGKYKNVKRNNVKKHMLILVLVLVLVICAIIMFILKVLL